MLRTVLVTIIGAVITLGVLSGCSAEPVLPSQPAQPVADAATTYQPPPITIESYLSEMRSALSEQENEMMTDQQLIALGSSECELRDTPYQYTSPGTEDFENIALAHCDVLPHNTTGAN